uniref:LIM zinc-binding domain-containing protein n=1 Tax=Arion vulgaris TaxID=1028688 RepID=A0A0B7BBX7_9EUPU
MSKKCAKCQKIVYPTEELKCLDKVWHKSCFKCEVCGMTLNMKNYKGYDKIPYCNAHCPTAKHTQVADTPETRRIAENTKIQSNVQYHADFEKQKGHKTSVVDDPELERTKQNTQIQSNVNYWGLKEQREQMEGRRPNDGLDDGRRPPQAQQQPSRPAQQQQQQQPSRPAQQQPSRPAQPQAKQVVYQALYNYTAADSDEVSFKEFDHIINVQEIDSGWMKGTVQRTGESGMLPSNYVERVN